MAKIDNDVAVAFCAGKALKISNTIVLENQAGVLLWGSCIAKRSPEREIAVIVDHCGYVTRPTLGRLHAILQRYTDGRVGCGIRKGEAELRYSDGSTKPFDGAVTVYRNVSWVDGSELA